MFHRANHRLKKVKTMLKPKKGSTYTIITAVGILLISAIVFGAAAQQATNVVALNMYEITKKITINIYNDLLFISSTEQGVKYYDPRKNFIIKLNSTHLELTYKDKTGTVADNAENTYRYAMRHHLKNVQDVLIDDPYIDRICISKKVVDCTSVITICQETEECCTISANSCKLVK